MEGDSEADIRPLDEIVAADSQPAEGDSHPSIEEVVADHQAALPDGSSADWLIPPSEWLTIGLGAATLAVTAVAVIVAILAWFGYKDIKRSAVKASKETGAAAASEWLASGALSRHVREAVDEILTDHVKDKLTEARDRTDRSPVAQQDLREYHDDVDDSAGEGSTPGSS